MGLVYKNCSAEAFCSAHTLPVSQQNVFGPSLVLLSRGFTLQQASTSTLRIFCRLVSGHSGLAYFQHILGNESSPLCVYCRLAVETSDHFIGSCIAHSTVRFQSFGVVSATFPFILSRFSFSSIIKFVRLTGRFARGYFSGRPPD